jgi:hypothetical protein
MTDHEDRFAASLDALSRGEPPATDDDLTRFVAEARSNWSNPVTTPPGSPPRLSAADRRHLWTAIQQEAAVKSSATHEGSHVMSATSLNVPTPTHPPTGWGATIARWQPVLSMAVMFAILAGLVGIAYTGLNRQENGPEPTTLAALQEEATPTVLVTGCAIHGTAPLTRDELADMSISDWPLRHYTPIAVADSTIANEALTLFQNWNNCSLSSAMQASSIEGPPPALQSYLSPRMQYISFLLSNPEQAPDEIDQVMMFSQDEVLSSGTLPLNRPMTTFWDPVAGIGYPSFALGDVYQLTDGRYGVTIGSISTAQLQSLASGAEVDHEPISVLIWVAFAEIDGVLYIDEYVPFCAASTPSEGQFSGSLQTDCVPSEIVVGR